MNTYGNSYEEKVLSKINRDEKWEEFWRKKEIEEEEERQRVIDELKLTKEEKAKIYKFKNENIKREILLLKNELDEFEENKKKKENIF